MPTIYLVRHGQTVWNRARRMQGQKDSPLTLRGIEQARTCAAAIAALLDGDRPPQMISSPLGRCWQTATIIADSLEISTDSIRLEPALKEITWGEWDGLTADEIEQRDAKHWQTCIDTQFAVAAPGGETRGGVLDRAQTWLSSLDTDAKLIVVSHGYFGRALRCAYSGLSDEAIIGMEEPQDEVFLLDDGRVSQWPAPDVESGIATR